LSSRRGLLPLEHGLALLQEGPEALLGAVHGEEAVLQLALEGEALAHPDGLGFDLRSTYFSLKWAVIEAPSTTVRVTSQQVPPSFGVFQL